MGSKVNRMLGARSDGRGDFNIERHFDVAVEVHAGEVGSAVHSGERESLSFNSGTP